MEKQYWTIVVRREIAEKNTTSEEEFEFLYRSKHRLSTIVTAVDDKYLGMACDTENSYELQEDLKSKYCVMTATAVDSLLTQ